MKSLVHRVAMHATHEAARFQTRSVPGGTKASIEAKRTPSPRERTADPANCRAPLTIVWRGLTTLGEHLRHLFAEPLTANNGLGWSAPSAVQDAVA